MRTYSDIKPGGMVQGAAGQIHVEQIDDNPNGVRVFHGTRPDTGAQASTWGCAYSDIKER